MCARTEADVAAVFGAPLGPIGRDGSFGGGLSGPGGVVFKSAGAGPRPACLRVAERAIRLWAEVGPAAGSFKRGPGAHRVAPAGLRPPWLPHHRTCRTASGGWNHDDSAAVAHISSDVIVSCSSVQAHAGHTSPGRVGRNRRGRPGVNAATERLPPGPTVPPLPAVRQPNGFLNAGELESRPRGPESAG